MKFDLSPHFCMNHSLLFAVISRSPALERHLSVQCHFVSCLSNIRKQLPTLITDAHLSVYCLNPLCKILPSSLFIWHK